MPTYFLFKIEFNLFILWIKSGIFRFAVFSKSIFGMWNKSRAASFVFYFYHSRRYFLFLRHCMHARTHALTVARTHNCTRASIIVLISREYEKTISIPLYRGTLLLVPFSRGLYGFRSNEICQSNPE